MRKCKIFIVCFVLFITCDKDPCPDVVKPPDPKPKMSNCFKDDSLPRITFRPVDKFGDTTNSSIVATLNYYTPYIADIYHIMDNDSIINIVGNHYYKNIKDCITSYVFFQDIKLTKDTIYLNNLNSLDRPAFAFLDCDFWVDFYDLDTTSSRNYFLFTSIDTTKRFLTAEFYCQFKKDPRISSNSWNVLRFCDGQIRLKY